MKIQIVYCSMWGYESQAVSLAEALMTSLKRKIQSLELVPSDKGRFEVSFDGKLVYSKLATGEFPDDMAIVQEALKAAK